MGHALKKMTSARIIVHEKGIPHLADPEKLWSSSIRVMGKTACDYMKPEPVDRDKMFAAYEDMTIDLKGIKLRIVSTPGHASHHYSLMDDENGRLFAGEAAGVYVPRTGGIRPASPFPFNLEKSIQSIDKLISSNPKTIYYSHFGCSDSAKEKLINSRDQMNLWGKIIKRYANIDNEINLMIIIEDIKNQERILSSYKVQQIIESAEKTLPEIKLPNPQGDTISLSSLKGKVILLDFWASYSQSSLFENVGEC